LFALALVPLVIIARKNMELKVPIRSASKDAMKNEQENIEHRKELRLHITIRCTEVELFSRKKAIDLCSCRLPLSHSYADPRAYMC
jgi:hypothetical protein